MACRTNELSIDIIITGRFTKAERTNGIIDFITVYRSGSKKNEGRSGFSWIAFIIKELLSKTILFCLGFSVVKLTSKIFVELSLVLSPLK